MALIQCPECGKTNISDSAEMCPECGYAVREHFEREKRKAAYAEQRRQLEDRKQREWEKLQSELDMKLKEIDDLRPSPEPVKPTLLKHMFYYGNSLSLLSWALIAAVVLFLLSYTAQLFIVLLAILLVLGIPFAAYITYLDWDIMLNCYKRDYNEWKEQQTNWAGYIEKRKAAVRSEYESIASNMAIYGSRQMPMPKIQSPKEQLKCPVCGATDIERISTMDRGFSVAMVGLASGKIGKQYKCKKCKHMW